jgi:NADH-quinone oxidoreductase subunit A
MPESVAVYGPIGIVILTALFLGVVTLVLAQVIGPKRKGPVKDSPYESGMPPIGGTDRRFHIRFYIVAMLFLLFDVEVLFLWPWARIFYEAATQNLTYPLASGYLAGKGFILGGMAMFFALLVFGLIYEWKKGAFRWD